MVVRRVRPPLTTEEHDELRRVTSIGWDKRTGTVNIHATAVDHDAPLREPRDADWTGQPLGAIVGRIADRSGLTAAVAPELRSVRPDEAVQSGESDRAFLGRIADAAGGEVAVRDGHLVVLVAGEALSAGSALPLDMIHGDGRRFAVDSQDFPPGP